MSLQTEPTSKVDALGNPVIFGNTYGYSTDCSGITTATVGIATKETKKYITLEVVEVREGVYSGTPKLTKTSKRFANVKAMKLFPVSRDQ